MIRLLFAALLALAASPALAQNGCPSGVGIGCTAPVSTGLAYSGASSATVGTTSAILIAAGTYTRILTICTLPTSTSNVWVRADGGTAASGTGLPVFAGGGCTTFGTQAQPLPTAAITAITDGSAAQTVTLSGG